MPVLVQNLPRTSPQPWWIAGHLILVVALLSACDQQGGAPGEFPSIRDDETTVSFLAGTTMITSTADDAGEHARLTFPTNVPGHGAFMLDTGMSTFGEVDDPTLVLGYNMSVHGGRPLRSEHALGWLIEADYDDGSNRLMEIYTQYLSADGNTQLRPLFFQFNRSTNRLSNSVIVGNPLNVTDDLGNSSLELTPSTALFKGDFLQSTSSNWNLHNTGELGNIYLTSNGGALYLNPSVGSGNVAIGPIGGQPSSLLHMHGAPDGLTDGRLLITSNKAGWGDINGEVQVSAGGSTTTDHLRVSVDSGFLALATNGLDRLTIAHDGSARFGAGSVMQVDNNVRVSDGSSHLGLIASGGINYIQSSTTTAAGSTAELRFTNMSATDTWAKFDTSGNFVSYKRVALGDAGPSWSTGVGSPEGVVIAPVGSMYSRTDGGPGTTLYVKELGTGSTGWAAK